MYLPNHLKTRYERVMNWQPPKLKPVHKKTISIATMLGIIIGLSIWFIIVRPTFVFADSLFKFDEGFGTNTNDTNQNVSSGTVTGATWKTKDLCIREKCLFFDGTQDYVSFADDADLDFAAANSFTINLWFRHAPKTSGTDILVGKLLDSDNDGGYEIQMESDGDITCQIEDDDANTAIDDTISSTAATYDDNQWHFVSCVKSGTASLTLYIDGHQIIQDASLDGSSTLENNDSFYIGIDGDGTSNDYTGFIDEVKIYRSARTAAEIKADFNKETPNRGTAVSFGPDNSWISKGLVGYWKMDETASPSLDSSGNGNSGTWNNTPAATTGRYGNGVYFDTATTNKYISVPAATSINNLSAFTISTWVNPAELQSTKIFGKGGPMSLYFDTVSGGLRTQVNMQCSGDDLDVFSTSADNMSLSTWHHIVVVWDGSGCGLSSTNVYIDGKLVIKHANSNPGTGTRNSDSGNNLIIGNDLNDLTTDQIQGSMDETRLYNRALSPAEVSKLYSFAPGPVGWWKMDENTGTTAVDTSGNSNDGTLSSGGGTSTIVSDPFTESSDTTLSSHTPNTTGTGWTSIINSVTCTEPSGAATAPVVNATADLVKVCNNGSQTDSGQWATAQPDPASTTQTISITVAVLDPGTSTRPVGIFGRRTDGDNAYVAIIRPNGHATLSALELYKISSGTATSLGTDDTNLVAADVVTLEITDATKRVLVNGAQRISSSDNAVTSVGTWGLGFGRWRNAADSSTLIAGNVNGLSGQGARLDDFLAQETTTGNPPTWTPGKYGSALSFAGNNAYVSRADDADFDFGTGTSFSYGAWIKHGAASAIQMIIVKYDTTAGNGGFKLYMETDGDLTCGIDDDEATFPEDSATSTAATYDDNLWHHVMCVKNTTSNLSLYIDGVLITNNSSITSSGDFANADPLYIGIAEDAASNNWIGQIDNVQIYNYARTPGQIIEDMNGGHPAPGSPVGSHVAHWKFDEGYGTTANDGSINANNLTLSTASWTNNGKFNKAFNGLTNVRLSRTTDADLEFNATDDFTLSLWFKSDSASNPAATEYLINDGAAAGSAGYAIYANTSGFLCFGIDDDASWGPDVASCTTTDVYDNTWHHVTTVRNVTLDTTYIYIDGVLKDSDTDTTSATLDSSPTFYIGDANATDGTDEFLGDIDEVKIFRSALTESQIKVLYNQSSQSVMGALSTNASGVASFSSNDSYCPPGQGSTCIPPIIHLKMDENTGTSTTYDSSTNNSNAAFTGSPSWATGKYGSGITLNGSSQWMEVASPGLPTGDFTYEIWLNPTDVTGVKTLFMSTASEGSGNELLINFNGDNLSLTLNGAGPILDVADIFSAGVWQHLAITRSESTVTGYLNGIVVDTGTNGDTLDFGTCQLLIGIDNDEVSCRGTASDYFNGTLDNAVIYNYARSPAQIAWDYNYGGPVAWLKFDENTGSPSTLNDSSGNLINGAASGTMDSSDWLAGKLNSSLDFDGSDDVVTITNSTPIDLNLGLLNGFTFSAWIYPNTVGETAGRIFQKSSNGSTTDSSSTFCRVTGSTPFGIECNLDLATSDAVVAVSSVALANQWTHIAFSWTNDADDEVTIWINGKPTTSSTSYSGDPTAEGNSMYIGGNGTTTSNTRAFDGQIDDFRIYNYELTSQQIKTVMNDGTIRFAPITGTP